MTKLSLRDLDVRGKRVLVRLISTSPRRRRKDRDHRDTLIRESLPTIRICVKMREDEPDGAFGRPKGKPVEKYSLRPVADHLHTLIDHPVAFSTETGGEIPEAIIRDMKEGDVTLLENVRFHAEEEANDPAFAEQLAKLGDVYVNDAFGAAHRAHASTAGITICEAIRGVSCGERIQYLSQSASRRSRCRHSRRSKCDKIGVIKRSGKATRLDRWRMANTFGRRDGRSRQRVEADKLALAKELLDNGEGKRGGFLLPSMR